MIETKVPKDIRAYDTKIIGPMTLRQFLILIIVIVIDSILYFKVLKPFNPSMPVIVYSLMLIDVPIGAFAVLKPMGLPLETYLGSVLVSMFVASHFRRAKNDILPYTKHKPPTKKQRKAALRRERRMRGVKSYK